MAFEFVHCFDFGCKSTQNIQFESHQWKKIGGLFNQSSNSFEEKQQIRQAIALMEQFAGQITGTSLDKGENYSGEDLPMQHDCIDESTNTFQYLVSLEKARLVKTSPG